MSTKCTKCKGATSSKGKPGDNGLPGLFGGYSSNWLFDAGTSSNPGAKDIRLNNATPSSATAIYVNKTNERSVDLSDFIAQFTSGNEYGFIRLFDEKDSSVFHYFRLTAVALASSVYTLTVSYIDGNGSFTDNNSLVLSFTPKVSKPKTIGYSFNTSTTDYISRVDPAAGVDIAVVLFDGLTFLGASPIAYDLIYDIDGGGTITAEMRDNTNTASISTPQVLASASQAIVTLAPTGNEPNGAAVFALKVTTASGTPTFKLYALNIKF